jgi:short-subunit dehydrogenase
MTIFTDKYGPWALIAGGAQGIGEAYSRYAAANGLNVAVLDLSAAALEALLPAWNSSSTSWLSMLPAHWC